MISAAASSFGTVLPQPTISADSTAGHASTDGDSPPSFDDVLQQHDGSPGQSATPPAQPSGDTKSGATTPTGTAAKAAATVTAPVAIPTISAGAPAKAPAPAIIPGSNLSAMIIQAAALAAKAPPVAATTNAGSVVSTTPPSSQTTAETSDLSALLAQAKAWLTGGKATVATVAAQAPASTAVRSTKTAKDSGSGTALTNTSTTTTVSTPIDLSTLIAQSSTLAQAMPASVGNELPSSNLSAVTIGSASKEKKSTSTSVGGSFLQSGTASSATLAGTFGALAGLQAVTSGATVSQQFTSNGETKNNPLTGVSAPAAAARTPIAGTANVEKEKAMNAQASITELTLLSGNGGSAVASPSSADLHIQLASNSDFTDALKQVMHVAQLTQTSGSSTPMRVEMEIQTPPGAIVNVYVSRQDDGWRAQLSTNDPAALSWVQDQVSSLRQSSDLGVEVKWLPPQLEGTATITTSGSQDSNLSWNQGGQGQSNYQQPDERPHSERQQYDDATPDTGTVSSHSFMDTFAALGRAA